MNKPYLDINKRSWNERTKIHVVSEFYDLPSFLKGKSSLKDIELGLLGDVQGKRVLHLQCHFGQDSLSLQRMGAKVTGIDLSDAAIEKAKELNNRLGLEAEFICSDVYSLPQNLHQKFDVVFTSYGVIGWLPDLEKWASVIKSFLNPTGKFIMVEFHPAVWMFDDDFKSVEYSYFKEGAIEEFSETSYTDSTEKVKLHDICWNHSLGEVLNALLNQGLSLAHFQEYNFSPYNCFNHTKKVGEDKYIIQPMSDKLPLTYSVVAEN